MTPAGLLTELEARGVVLVADPDRLRYRPRSAVPAHLLSALIEHAAELQQLLLVREQRTKTDAPAAGATVQELAWRVEAMLPQVPPSGPIVGLLMVRDGAWPADGHHCVSCGDPLPPAGGLGGPVGLSARCEYCCEAAWIAVQRGRAAR